MHSLSLAAHGVQVRLYIFRQTYTSLALNAILFLSLLGIPETQCEAIIDACKTNISQTCDQICVKSSHNSFSCQCHDGYFLASDGRTCVPHDCQAPPLNDCPSNSYSDRFSSVCNKVNYTCPSGTTYLKQCSFSCTSNYQLARIVPRAGKRFGEDFAAVDFSSVYFTITCVLSLDGATVKWDQASELSSYYCRRMNDPPTDITLNGKSLLEHSKYKTVIGTLNAQDPQQGQMFVYIVEKPSFLFGCQGNKLLNHWYDPKLNPPFDLSGGGINVTVRATDNGAPPYWSEKVFRITIKDVNDPPESLSISNSKVYDNASVGSLVGRLSAIDGDQPSDAKPHSNFTWELVDSDGGRFSLSGENLLVAKLLNHLVQRYHRIIVKCSDYGSPVRSTEKYFVIDVQNIKEKPVGLKLTKSSVHESANAGTVVGQLIATDEDGDAISFDISQSDSDTLDKFAIGSVSCQGSGNQYSCQVDLMVKSLLDYEATKLYHLIVYANDSEGHGIFVNFRVDIINDNEQPASVFLTGSHRVSENALPGTAIGQFVVSNVNI